VHGLKILLNRQVAKKPRKKEIEKRVLLDFKLVVLGVLAVRKMID